MSATETFLPATKPLTLEDVEVQVARLRAETVARSASRYKDTHDDFVSHPIETIISDSAESRLGGIALTLSSATNAEFTIPEDEN